ncbi:MAG: hypothetical protein ACJ8H8_34625 [Geminicoccaceae bacterium]
MITLDFRDWRASEAFWKDREYSTHPRCAVCRAGKDRWFWCVVNGRGDWKDERHVFDVQASGTAPTQVEALAAAAAHAPEDAVLDRAGLAALVRLLIEVAYGETCRRPAQNHVDAQSMQA